MNLLDQGEFRAIPVQLAMRIGANEAAFCYQLDQWLRYHRRRGKPKVREGREWYYSTLENWVADFPFWSLSKVRRIIKSCEDQGVVISANYNRIRDRTKWYAIDYDHEHFQPAPSVHNEQLSSVQNDSMELSKTNSSNHKITTTDNQEITEISPKAKTVTQIAAEQNLGTPDEPNGFDFQEAQVLDDLMEHREHGHVISVWWRKCMRGYGHVNHVLPELTQKDQKQLKTLIKQLGPTGPLRIMLALRFWPEYKKYADAEFGLKSTVKPVIQKFVLGRNAIAGFEAPKEVDYTEKDWKSL